MTMETSAVIRLRYEELLFYTACVSNCWCVCLCVFVCLEGRVCRRGGGGGMRMGSSWRWQLSRVMRLALRWCRLCRPQRGSRGGGTKPWIGGRFLELWNYSKLLLKSLYFNSLSNSDTLLDCVFEPVYWIVDNVTRWFGVVSCWMLLLPLHLHTLFLTRSSFSLSGVCHSSHTAHNLSCGYHLLIRPTHDPQHLPHALGRLAPLLWTLASRDGGLPLLQGHHHLSRTPTQGTLSPYVQTHKISSLNGVNLPQAMKIFCLYIIGNLWIKCLLLHCHRQMKHHYILISFNCRTIFIFPQCPSVRSASLQSRPGRTTVASAMCKESIIVILKYSLSFLLSSQSFID